eukprot:1160079-Pelagomonas_calceolata.AAC.8
MKGTLSEILENAREEEFGMEVRKPRHVRCRGDRMGMERAMSRKWESAREDEHGMNVGKPRHARKHVWTLGRAHVRRDGGMETKGEVPENVG